MSARIKELKDINDNKLYPVTVVDAIYMPDGKTKLLEEVMSTGDRSYELVFNNSGYVKTLENGDTITATFGSNDLVEVYKYADGTEYYTKTTTFNDNGSISATIEYSEGDRYGS